MIIILLALTAVLAAWPARAAAQDVEIGALLGWNFSGINSNYGYSFVPPFPYKPYTGMGALSIDLKNQSSGLGYGGFLNIAMRDHWLLQLSYNRYSTVLLSPVSTYNLALQYTASSPAGTPPQPFTYSSSVDWPNVQGTMKNSVLSVDLIYRLGSTGGLALDLIGGLSYFHFSGTFQALAVTRFGLDANGGLTSEEFGLAVDFGPKNTFGANGGAALNVHFNSNFGLVLEGRYYYCPAIQTSAGFSVIALTDQTPINLSTVNFHKNPFKVSGSFLSLQGGFKVMF
jgi:hypothetical protein